MTTDRIAPVSQGEMLLEEFMKPLGLTAHTLAASTGLTETCVSAVVEGTQAITEEIDAALCSHFGLSPGWWLRLQVMRDSGNERPASPEQQ